MKKIILSISLIIFFILINTVVNAKYILDKQFEVANLNIDRAKPTIEIVSITNTNKGYENYANKTHIIEITAKFKDKNLDKVLCDKDHIKIKVDNNYIQSSNIQFSKISEQEGEKIYKIILKEMNYNGKLKLQFNQGTAIDKSLLENDLLEVDTKIILDNIAPTGSTEEKLISEGKSSITINLSEKIRNLEGWEFIQEGNKIKKEFTNNIVYELPIIDYAGNKQNIIVNVTKASNINVVYASHNSEIGWTFGYGNYDVAGKTAIDTNPRYKTESLAFNFSGNIEKDFVQANAYIYTHWGEGTKVNCVDGTSYNHGYNPSQNTYKSMKSQLVTINNKQYFQLGGIGVNLCNDTETLTDQPRIPKDIADQYPYGVCGIKMILKDYSYYSIVYQIYVENVGWIKACSDGQECMYSKTKPMSAFRIALIPKTEKQFVIDTWNKGI